MYVYNVYFDGPASVMIWYDIMVTCYHGNTTVTHGCYHGNIRSVTIASYTVIAAFK